MIAIMYCKLFMCKMLCQGLYLSLLSYSEYKICGVYCSHSQLRFHTFVDLSISFSLTF